MRFVDRTVSPPVDTTIAPLDLHLSDLSLTTPVRIDLRTTVAGTSPTIVHTRGTIGPVGEVPFATDVPIEQHVTVRSGVVDVADLAVSGQVRRDGAGRPIATLRLATPALRAGDVDVTAVEVALAEANGAAQLQKLTLDLLGGTITGTARVEHVRTPSVFGMQTSVRGMDLTQVIALRTPDTASRFAGRLDVDWTLTGSAGDEAAVRRSLAGNGRVVIRDGVLEGVNVADAVLSSVTGMAGLVSLISPRIRDRHPALFSTDDTRFDELSADVRIANERIVVALVVSAKDYAIRGQGTVGLISAPTCRGRSAPARLADPGRPAVVPGLARWRRQRLEIPFRLTGTFPDVKARPDQEYLTRALRKALVEGGLDALIGGGHGDEKGDGKGDPAARLRRKLDRLFR